MSPDSRLTALVTGANSGIGKVTARALAARGMDVILVCRSRERGKAALNEIQSQTNNPRLRLLLCDLSSQKDIRRVADEVKVLAPQLDLLVNNAGAVNPVRTETVDGYENTFATNHLAYFLLTNLLLDQLQASPAGRVVSTASQASMMGKIHWDDVNLSRGYAGFKAYSQSKLANIMFTFELARRLAGTSITANCIHPGFVATGFAGTYTGLFSLMMKLSKPFARTPEKGAETLIWAATAPELAGVTGKYFANKKEIYTRAIARDADACRRLWELSEKMTGMGK
jgi:retinol dehydrogenase 14